MLCTTANKTMNKFIIESIYEFFPDVKSIFIYETDINSELLYIYRSNITKEIPNTIILHRKGEFNVYYTLNAMNKILENMNNGRVVDTDIEWELFKDSIVTCVNNELVIKNIKNLVKEYKN